MYLCAFWVFFDDLLFLTPVYRSPKNKCRYRYFAFEFRKNVLGCVTIFCNSLRRSLSTNTEVFFCGSETAFSKLHLSRLRTLCSMQRETRFVFPKELWRFFNNSSQAELQLLRSSPSLIAVTNVLGSVFSRRCLASVKWLWFYRFHPSLVLCDSPLNRFDCIAHLSTWPRDWQLHDVAQFHVFNTRDPHCFFTVPVNFLLCGNFYWSWFLSNSSSGVCCQGTGPYCTLVSTHSIRVMLMPLILVLVLLLWLCCFSPSSAQFSVSLQPIRHWSPHFFDPIICSWWSYSDTFSNSYSAMT